VLRARNLEILANSHLLDGGSEHLQVPLGDHALRDGALVLQRIIEPVVARADPGRLSRVRTTLTVTELLDLLHLLLRERLRSHELEVGVGVREREPVVGAVHVLRGAPGVVAGEPESFASVLRVLHDLLLDEGGAKRERLRDRDAVRGNHGHGDEEEAERNHECDELHVKLLLWEGSGNFKLLITI
jgi:hypothetical protein